MAWGLSWVWLTLGKWWEIWRETESGVGGKCPWGVQGSLEWECLYEERKQFEVG